MKEENRPTPLLPLYQLDPEDPFLFPPADLVATNQPACIGGDLSAQRLLAAYPQGYFPWFNPGDPILWWNPDPRFVLFPDRLKVAKSMRPYFNQKKYIVTYDKAFETVIEHCEKTPRRGQRGSWIDVSIRDAYTELHQLGYAHSVEVWTPEQELVGGLYGLALGKVFFGESMFALAPNASKFGFISLVRRLEERGYELIDCQQATRHLRSLGGESIDRASFVERLEKIDVDSTEVGPWAV